MAMRRKMAENSVLTSVHGTAVGLNRAGLIDKAIMREFDALCLRASGRARCKIGTLA